MSSLLLPSFCLIVQLVLPQWSVIIFSLPNYEHEDLWCLCRSPCQVSQATVTCNRRSRHLVSDIVTRQLANYTSPCTERPWTPDHPRWDTSPIGPATLRRLGDRSRGGVLRRCSLFLSKSAQHLRTRECICWHTSPHWPQCLDTEKNPAPLSCLKLITSLGLLRGKR